MDALRHEHPAWTGHLVLLHDGEAERAEAVLSWAESALAADQKIIYMDSGDGYGITGPLDEAGVDVAGALAEGRLEIVGPAAFYARGAVGQLVDRALDDGFPGVRISGQLRYALSVQTWQEYQVAERRLSMLCERLPLHFLCQYDLELLHGERLEQAAAVHPAGVRRHRFWSDDAGDGVLRLSGDLDRRSAPALAAVVATAVHAAGESGADRLPWQRQLTLDLGGAWFLDVAGCRAVLQATEPLRRTGGRVLLLRPRVAVERVLRLMDVDVTPGFDIRGDG